MLYRVIKSKRSSKVKHEGDMSKEYLTLFLMLQGICIRCVADTFDALDGVGHSLISHQDTGLTYIIHTVDDTGMPLIPFQNED